MADRVHLDLDRYLGSPVSLIADCLILPDEQRFGDVMAGFQRKFFEAVFAVRDDGVPRHRLVYSERRRGESKTEDVAAAGLADLLTGPPQSRSYVVAGDQDQAGLVLDSVRGFVYRSPILADLLVQRDVVVNPATGSELRVLSSDAPTSFGIRPRKVFFDELSLQRDEELWTSMWTSVGKNARSQMVSVSMAGWDFASLGWRIREQARGNSSYYFSTREGTDPAPWLSREQMQEQQETLHPADFARFWECRWVEPKGSWITAEMYDAAVTGTEAHTAPDSRPVGFVDVGLVHDATALAVVHRDSEGVCVLDTLRTMQGSKSMPVDLDELERLVRNLTRQFSVSRWVFEAPQAAASVQRLQKQLPVPVEIRYPTADSMARLFGGLYSLFSSRRLRLYPHEQLRREALSLVTKSSGGRIKVVDSGAIHQDHVVALGGACDLLAEDDRGELLIFEVYGTEEEEADMAREDDRKFNESQRQAREMAEAHAAYMRGEPHE